MFFRCGILVSLFLIYWSICFPQQTNRIMPSTPPPTPECVREDSISDMSCNNLRLYDSLAVKSSRRTIPRLLYGLLVRPYTDNTTTDQVLDESSLYAPYNGLRISRITIDRSSAFNDDGNWLERTGNKIHVTTRERVIDRDLLFHVGDTIDGEQLVRNKQLLRSRPYISDAWIELQPDSLDSTRVEILVRTRDSWTISADLSFDNKGNTMFGVYDANILGTGNKLTIKTHFDYKTFNYGGNIFAYEIPNVLGTFYTAQVSAGRNFENKELRLGLRKEFIRPTDYEFGATFNDVQSPWYLVDRDTSELVRVRDLNLWGGRSQYITPIRSSIFVTGRYSYAHYFTRPDVAPEHNTLFHNYDNLLFGLGLYREKFYSANMVYGFGTKEYIAAGYNAQLSGGYSWGEFAERMYLSTSFKAGNFTSAGYFMGSFSLGSYIDLSDGSWRQSTVDVDLRWFSNLLSMRRNRIRQFLSLNYTQGWNRGTGSNEIIRFTRTNGPRALREHITGTNRMVFNSETVFFTPFQPLGFRFAFFAFLDLGLMGNSANPFGNEFFSSFGAGVRIKNERLIFSAIQIQLGISVGKRGWLDSRYFNISNQTKLEQYRYIPSRPEVVGFE